MRSKIHINAVFSLLQVVITSLVLFITYKYLIAELGVEKLGIWSLIVASVSILNLGSLGLSATLVRYVAKYLVSNNQERISFIIQTALITVVIVAIVMIVIVYFLASYLLKVIVPLDQIVLSTELLPYGLLNVLILLPAGIILSALDGAQKIYLRNLLLIASSILFLISIYYFVPIFNLLGVVYAQIFQSIFTLLTGWFFIKRVFDFLPLIPYRWDLEIFREIIGYGTNLQLITICQMLYEPITKSVLTKFGGLAAVGYYEMANRLVLKTREMILSVFQVLIPVYASQNEKDSEKVKSTYSKSINYLLFLAIPIFSLLIIATPLISRILFGSFEDQFYIFTSILFCSWFINIISSQAYFAFLGIGLLKWNVISSLVTAIINLALSYFLGLFYGGIGTVFGWAIAVSLGSSIISFKFNSLHGINFFEIISRANKVLFLISILLILTTTLIQFYFLRFSIDIFINSGFILLLVLILSYSLWNNPIRRELTNSLKLLFTFK